MRLRTLGFGCALVALAAGGRRQDSQLTSVAQEQMSKRQLMADSQAGSEEQADTSAPQVISTHSGTVTPGIVPP